MDSLVERSYQVRLNFTQPMLGSRPTTNIARAFVLDRQTKQLATELRKAGVPFTEAQAQAAEQVAASFERDGLEEEETDEPVLRPTAFASDAGGLYIDAYVVQSFLKAAAAALKLKVPGKSANVWANRDLQLLTWIFAPHSDDLRLYLDRDGKRIQMADGLLERPLRAETPTGSRVSIAVSEELVLPIGCNFRIDVLAGCRIARDQFKHLLDYGRFQGISQWRGSGHGRFTYEFYDAD